MLAAAGLAAAHPKVRFNARNLFGKKGLDNFLASANASDKEAQKILARFKDHPQYSQFVEATKGMSAWNLRRMSRNMIEGYENFLTHGAMRIKTATGYTTVPLVNLTTKKASDVYIGVKQAKPLMEQMNEIITKSKISPFAFLYRKDCAHKVTVMGFDATKRKASMCSFDWHEVPSIIRGQMIKANADEIAVTTAKDLTWLSKTA